MNSIVRGLRTALTLGLLALGMTPAAERPVSAQYVNPYTFRNWNNPLSSTADTVIMQRMQQLMLERSMGSGAPAHTGRPGTPGPAVGRRTHRPAARAPISTTDFRPLGTRLLPDVLARAVPSADRQQQKELRDFYLQLLTGFEQEARRNNVAYALAFFGAVSAQVVSGAEITDAESEELVRAVNEMLAGSPEFQRLNAREKQALYEAAVITGGVIFTLHRLGVEQNDPTLLRLARELAQSALGGAGVGTP